MRHLEIRHWPEDNPLDHDTVAHVWARDAFGYDLWLDPPERRWLDFVHEMDERVIVKEGKIELEVEGARAMLGPGEEVFIPAGSRHSVWNRGSSTARWFYGYKNR